MRKINPAIFVKIQASLKRNYLMFGQPVPPSAIINDSSLSRWDPHTIERTLRVMAQRGMVDRPKKGLYKPRYEGVFESERIKTLEEFA